MSLAVARGAAPSPASVSSGRSVFPCETSGSRAVPAKLGCLPWPEGLILSWWKLAPCHPANGPAAHPRAAKPAAAEGQLECSPLSASYSFPHFSLLILSPSVHPSPLLFIPLYSRAILLFLCEESLGRKGGKRSNSTSFQYPSLKSHQVTLCSNRL